jgi:hypothetical protein
MNQLSAYCLVLSDTSYTAGRGGSATSSSSLTLALLASLAVTPLSYPLRRPAFSSNPDMLKRRASSLSTSESGICRARSITMR